MEWLNYHHLLYFWTVAREGTIARASEELRLAQPTISGQIRALEDQLGEKLFQRSGRNLVLTEIGRVVYRYADDIFATGRELMDTLKDRPDRPAGAVAGRGRRRGDEDHRVSIARTGAQAASARPHRVPRRRAGAPADRPRHARARSRDRRRADLTRHQGQGLHARRSAKRRSPCFGTPKLAAPRRKNFPRSLDGAPFLVPTVGKTLRRTLDHYFDQESIRPRIVAELDDSALLTTFGQGGAGLFVAPTVLEKEVMRQFGVVVVGRLDDGPRTLLRDFRRAPAEASRGDRHLGSR